jgi:F0F1-type ATP synthase membrane subunit c/vacuolar-type H+-ATPase subunit K
LVTTGVVCLVLAVASGLIAWTGSRRYAQDGESSQAERFLFGMAKGASAIFALVIALSLVPVALLSPCPL